MLLRFLLLLVLIPIVASMSYQEDLAISTYSHIGCLTLNSQRQYLIKYIQTNPSLSYQTFSSSNMTIELCFRLCRRWIIVINSNHTKCMCLYTMHTPHQFRELLGDVSSLKNCTSDALQIYSLTKNFNLLPSLKSNYEWSLDGCYYLHGIQNYRPNSTLTHANHIQAIDLCRKTCETVPNKNYFAFFLSLRKACYCLPIATPKTAVHIAVRKPLVHCSYLPYIRDVFGTSSNYSEVHSDTVIKIDVQRYCSPAFTFDKNFYLCLKLVALTPQSTYSQIAPNDTCSPLLIKTQEQWQHLISYPFITNTCTYIWVDRNSTFIFHNLFESKKMLPLSNDLCITIDQSHVNRLSSFNLLPCSMPHPASYVLCAQQTFETIITNQADVNLLRNDEQVPIVHNSSCPTDFVLFNNMCYYVHPSTVSSIQSAERLCSSKSSNSTLVKLNSHEWGNINITKFHGRTFDDILLEFFYYQSEKTIERELKYTTNQSYWLRLLFENNNSPNECVLRYFIRSSGVFTTLERCNDGGHPVCQCQPIPNNVSKIIIIDETTTHPLDKTITTDSITTTKLSFTTTTSTIAITLAVSVNSTNIPFVSNESQTHTSDQIPDQGPRNNETNIDYPFNNNTLMYSKSSPTRSRSFLTMITAALLALAILIIGILLFVRYGRRSRGSYSTRNNATDPTGRTKRSSIRSTSDGKASIPAVLYTKLKSTSPSTAIDLNMLHPFDNSLMIDDNVQLLPHIIDETKPNESIIPEVEEESLYAIPKLPNEK